MDKPGLGRLLFLKIILLYYQCGVKGCQVTVKQENDQVFEYFGKNIKLSCQFTATDCGNGKEMSWFRYLASSHENLSQRNDGRFTPSISANYLYLEIRNVTLQDSGIYVCGITYSSQQPTSQNCGDGITLTVLDENYKTITAGNTALIILCTLLIVYCVTVFSYYAYRSKWKICKLKQDKDVPMNQTHKTKSRMIFQAIAQEYHKRYDGKSKKQQNQVIEDDTIYQNTNYTH